MEIRYLSEKELEVMEILWSHNRGLSSSEIIELSKDSSWKKSSIHILINSLLSKGSIEVDSFVQQSKTYARTFKPLITYEEYFATQFKQRKFFSNDSVPKIVSALIENQEDTASQKELTRELRKIIEKKINALEKE